MNRYVKGCKSLREPEKLYSLLTAKSGYFSPCRGKLESSQTGIILVNLQLLQRVVFWKDSPVFFGISPIFSQRLGSTH